MRLGEGGEVRDGPHPLSPAGPAIYDFELGDTTQIKLTARKVREVTLRVRPKDFGLPRIVGTLYLDAETADLVRMAFNFTPRSYLDAELEDVSIVLDNALWERRYWLPYRQEIEIRRRATWLDVPVRGIIRARWEIDGYVLNLGLANSWFAGDEITFLPKAERDSFPWKEPLGAALQDIAEPVRQNDLERVRAEVEQIAGRRILTGLKGRRLGVRGVSDLLHANRVEGLAAGAGVVGRGGGARRGRRGPPGHAVGGPPPQGAPPPGGPRGGGARPRARASRCGAICTSRRCSRVTGRTAAPPICGSPARVTSCSPRAQRGCCCGRKAAWRAPSSQPTARSCSVGAGHCWATTSAAGADGAWPCCISSGAFPSRSCPSASGRTRARLGPSPSHLTWRSAGPPLR